MTIQLRTTSFPVYARRYDASGGPGNVDYAAVRYDVVR
jgi:hypothetical protein